MTNESINTFHNLQSTLDDMDYSESNALQIIQNLDRLSLAALLDESIKNSNILSAIAQYSYVHQLGFEKYCLFFSQKKEITLRLHYWPETLGDAQEDIHDHCADFCSRVLLGDITHLCYEKDVNSDKYFEYSYSLNSHTQHSELTCLGSSNLRYQSDKHVTAPNLYFFEKDLLHCVKKSNKETITLSLWGPRTKNAIVYRKNYIEKESGIGRQPLTELDVRNRLIYIKNLLKS